MYNISKEMLTAFYSFKVISCVASIESIDNNRSFHLGLVAKLYVVNSLYMRNEI